MDIRDFRSILRGSKSYSFEGSVLTITGYYTGESVSIDLLQIDEEMLEVLLVEGDADDYDY